jgi:hypothetical protein
MASKAAHHIGRWIQAYPSETEHVALRGVISPGSDEARIAADLY